MIEINGRTLAKGNAISIEMVIRRYCNLKYDPENAISPMHMVSESKSLLEKYSNVLKYDKKVQTIFGEFSDYECYNSDEKAEDFCKCLKLALKLD